MTAAPGPPLPPGTVTGPPTSNPPASSDSAAQETAEASPFRPKGATVVHGYTLHETLGTGTFGRVRRATKDDAEYAIKIVSRQQLAATAMTPQLKREVAIQKSLVHPNIVQLGQVLRSPNKLYMVLELAAEGELYWAIQRNGPLPMAAARRALFQLADALYYCHERGVVHRDVKPENVLLDHRRNIKLTDFGLSSSADPAHAHAYGGVEHLPDPRMLRTACGSPHYCAPEVRSGSHSAYNGPKADAWSVGVVLFLMVNGFLPFHDDDPDTLQHLVESSPVAYPDDMPHAPRRICENLLVRDISARWSLDRVLGDPWIAADPTLVRAVASPACPLVYPPTASEREQPGQAAAAGLAPTPAAPSIASAAGAAPEDCSAAPTGWYTFGRHAAPSAPAPPRALPREEVPEQLEDSSSDVESTTEEVPLKPRRKSLLSRRSRPRLLSGNFHDRFTEPLGGAAPAHASGHSQANYPNSHEPGSARAGDKSRRESSLRSRKSSQRRALASLLTSSREVPPPPPPPPPPAPPTTATPEENKPVPNGTENSAPQGKSPAKRVSKLVFAKKFFRGGSGGTGVLGGHRKRAYPTGVQV